MFRVLIAHIQEALRNNTWYIACVLCLLAATTVGMELVPLQNYTILHYTDVLRCTVNKTNFE
jgi:hypothetical protein